MSTFHCAPHKRFDFQRFSAKLCALQAPSSDPATERPSCFPPVKASLWISIRFSFIIRLCGWPNSDSCWTMPRQWSKPAHSPGSSPIMTGGRSRSALWRQSNCAASPDPNGVRHDRQTDDGIRADRPPRGDGCLGPLAAALHFPHAAGPARASTKDRIGAKEPSGKARRRQIRFRSRQPMTTPHNGQNAGAALSCAETARGLLVTAGPERRLPQKEIIRPGAVR